MPNTKDLNQAAFRKLKPRVDRSYPVGRFIAVADGKVIADAGDLRSLREQVRALGRNPRDTLVFQAGVDYPDNATILVERPAGAGKAPGPEPEGNLYGAAA